MGALLGHAKELSDVHDAHRGLGFAFHGPILPRGDAAIHAARSSSGAVRSGKQLGAGAGSDLLEETLLGVRGETYRAAAADPSADAAADSPAAQVHWRAQGPTIAAFRSRRASLPGPDACLKNRSAAFLYGSDPA